ncbi:helix-turn-helix transcriptional regulator [Lachnospiraceae bacterium 46-61]
MVLSKNLKLLREQNNMTQQELADKVGVSRPLIAAIENDTKSAKVQTLIQIADVLGCTLDELVKEKGGQLCFQKNCKN